MAITLRPQICDVMHFTLCIDGVPAPAKGAQQPPLFRPMSIVTTVAHLSYCWAVVFILVLMSSVTLLISVNRKTSLSLSLSLCVCVCVCVWYELYCCIASVTPLACKNHLTVINCVYTEDDLHDNTMKAKCKLRSLFSSAIRWFYVVSLSTSYSAVASGMIWTLRG